MIRVGILTVSDRVSRGEATDRSGPALTDAFSTGPFAVSESGVVPDDIDAISAALRRMCSACDVIVSTGGTGLSPRDVTPEATLPLLDRLIPGIPELLRADGVRTTPMAALSRGLCGTCGECMILNLPGSVGAVKDAIRVLLPILPHAIETLRGEGEHGGMGR